jgi:hypothetical protein
MAQACQRPIIEREILRRQEATMCAALFLAPEAKEAIEQGEWPEKQGDLLAWEMDSTPRLRSSDLVDPKRFYQRLETWLMNQK